MKNIVILAYDEKLIFALGNTLLQLKKYSYIDSIFVYLKSDNLQIINAILGISDKINIIQLKDNDIIKYLNFNYKQNKFINVYGLIIFAKFLGFDHINQCDNIIFFDLDMLFQKDFDMIITGYPISYKKRGLLNQYIECDSKFTVPNAGVVCINKSILNYVNDLKSAAFDAVNELVNYPNIDEIVFGYIAYKYNIPVKLYDGDSINVAPFNSHSQSAVIVHGAIPHKFWSHPLSNFLFNKWNEFNNEWNKLCDRNELVGYKYKVKFEEPIDNRLIFLLHFYYIVYSRIWDCHRGFKIFFSKSDRVKVFIIDIIPSIHFEVMKSGYDYKVLFHDETASRNETTANMLKNILKKVNLPLNIYPNRFEAIKYITIDALKNYLHNTYESIKDDLHRYSLFYKTK